MAAPLDKTASVCPYLTLFFHRPSATPQSLYDREQGGFRPAPVSSDLKALATGFSPCVESRRLGDFTHLFQPAKSVKAPIPRCFFWMLPCSKLTSRTGGRRWMNRRSAF